MSRGQKNILNNSKKHECKTQNFHSKFNFWYFMETEKQILVYGFSESKTSLMNFSISSRQDFVFLIAHVVGRGKGGRRERGRSCGVEGEPAPIRGPRLQKTIATAKTLQRTHLTTTMTLRRTLPEARAPRNMSLSMSLTHTQESAVCRSRFPRTGR